MGYPLLDLTNKTAVVIGGTSGIGLALIKALAQAGANVIPTSRRSEQVRSAVAEVEALGCRSLVKTCDVTDESSLTQVLDAVCAEFGGVQLLVNCAGRTKRAPTLEVPESEWQAILETNLNGTLHACRVFGATWWSGATGALLISPRWLLLWRFMKSPLMVPARRRLQR